MFACMHARTSHSRATESSSSERQTAERFMLTSNQLLTGTWKTGISRHQAALRRLYLTRLLPLSVCFAHAVNWSGVALLSQKHSQCGRNGRRDMRPSLLAFTLNSTSAQWYVGTLFSKRHTVCDRYATKTVSSRYLENCMHIFFAVFYWTKPISWKWNGGGVIGLDFT